MAAKIVPLGRGDPPLGGRGAATATTVHHPNFEITSPPSPTPTIHVDPRCVISRWTWAEAVLKFVVWTFPARALPPPSLPHSRTPSSTPQLPPLPAALRQHPDWNGEGIRDQVSAGHPTSLSPPRGRHPRGFASKGHFAAIERSLCMLTITSIGLMTHHFPRVRPPLYPPSSTSTAGQR